MADKIDLPPLYRTVPSAPVADRRKKPDQKTKDDSNKPRQPKPDRGKGKSRIDEYV